MEIQILNLTEGARKAEGLTVIIDVFRAFTLEAVLYHNGAERIIAAADEAEARSLKREYPQDLLIGERHGRILPGFDYGNAPSALLDRDFNGRSFIHTTTNGTQGLAAAVHADEILTGALVNARAVARYILNTHPEKVSLVAMGWEGKKTEEDILCAQYIRSLLEGNPMKDIAGRADDLRYTEGKKFFDPSQQDVFPQADFSICTSVDLYDFVIRAEKVNHYFRMKRLNV